VRFQTQQNYRWIADQRGTESWRINLVDPYIEVERYVYRHGAGPRSCKCLQFWDLLPTMFGFTIKSNSCSWENMVKVNIFSWAGVEALVRGNTILVESILGCDCNACNRVQSLENVKTVEKIISDMQLFSKVDKGVPPTGNDPPKDQGVGGSKAVLFAMLCYLGTPFMIYFDIWEYSSREPGEFGLMKFHLDQDRVFECIHRLYELQQRGAGDTAINEQTNNFIEAFQQVERQFQPLQLSPQIQSLTVPDDTVLPFHDFKYWKRGARATIYVIKVLGEFRDSFNSTDVCTIPAMNLCYCIIKRL